MHLTRKCLLDFALHSVSIQQPLPLYDQIGLQHHTEVWYGFLIGTFCDSSRDIKHKLLRHLPQVSQKKRWETIWTHTVYENYYDLNEYLHWMVTSSDTNHRVFFLVSPYISTIRGFLWREGCSAWAWGQVDYLVNYSTAIQNYYIRYLVTKIDQEGVVRFWRILSRLSE